MQRNIEFIMMGIAATLLVIALFFGSLANAGHMSSIPKEFDQGEHPDAVIIHADVEVINKMCAAAVGDDPEPGTYYGCAFTWPDKPDCVLMLPTPKSIGIIDYVFIRRHEMAHCWGWSH